jgi:hypothetical protein
VKMKEVAGRDQCYLYVDAVRTLFDLDGGEAAPEAPGQPSAAGALPPEPPPAPEEPRAGPGAAVHDLPGTGTEDA